MRTANRDRNNGLLPAMCIGCLIVLIVCGVYAGTFPVLLKAQELLLSHDQVTLACTVSEISVTLYPGNQAAIDGWNQAHLRALQQLRLAIKEGHRLRINFLDERREGIIMQSEPSCSSPDSEEMFLEAMATDH